MTVSVLLFIILAIGATGYALGVRRARAAAGGDTRKLHSLTGYHGQSVLLFSAVPALVLLGLWLVLQPLYLDHRAGAMIAVADIPEGGSLDLVLADVRRVAEGLDLLVASGGMTEDDLAATGAADSDLKARLGGVGVALAGEVGEGVFEAARDYRHATHGLSLAMAAATIAAALAGLVFALRRIGTDYRARNVSEGFVLLLFIASSLVAVLTTVGIVASLLIESIHFFRLYPARDFLFSLTWNPQFRGGSDLGIWPLLWGTLYVSFVALLFAVPVGLLSAIYLSEYASRRLRALAKPAIEVLAGIPTIVYGLFALVTVGPFLRDWFAQPLGLGSGSSSVMTAGLVMGIMLIPFVSSLSDDIINAVPQSLRDGSYGLGATQSETVRQVILPAALPGIVGAVLLAASRAIGETMIVVMGAGAAAKLDLNPFEAMTTITVKIVSQLTGDTEFASPETLVAFALGMALFVFTLGLNIVALYVVRKYREQYE
ncbi:MAG: phosphate ABC transporter permease subunit PstC [Rhodobacteraceae bacterium]|nr:phosphate ABC transporter permease subunit PstC [Paracoccaceae bacterium]MCC0046452.1 phosphate ABC transporter permease subunit PstC [Defluviimonas sp.]MCP5323920.1 phosphate ABC transporter permease subunit PstC [Paracoccaceae bacterium]MCP5356247.1 phosphate ABC transporter permease subunit PstC [Paracoccaceae bacterium]MCP5376933.1 phosphate ABC transporter permease subunit PstC [Paracoccaceae bacterium]